MASSLGSAAMQRSAVSSAPCVAANRSLLRPQPLLQRGRTLGAGSIAATTKTPTPVKITIQGRRLPVRTVLRTVQGTAVCVKLPGLMLHLKE